MILYCYDRSMQLGRCHLHRPSDGLTALRAPRHLINKQQQHRVVKWRVGCGPFKSNGWLQAAQQVLRLVVGAKDEAGGAQKDLAKPAAPAAASTAVAEPQVVATTAAAEPAIAAAAAMPQPAVASATAVIEPEVADSSAAPEEATEAKSDEYTEEMQARMGTTLTYRHEDGINYNYVLPDLIVGSCLQGPEDVDRLQQAGVTTVFSLQEDCDMEWFGIDIAAIQARCREVGLQHVRFPVRDFDPFDLRLKLPKAVARLAKAHKAGEGAAYIHCTAGMGRAPATALAYMFWLRGWQLPAAWEALTSVRACSPRIEAIRAATADLLTDSKALDVTVSMRRRGTASKVQVAGLDVGWHTLLDLQENPVTHRLEVTRQLLPGSYPFKFILDGTWCANHDYPTYKDGDNNNNIIIVLPRDATDNAIRERLLSQTGDLLDDERDKLASTMAELGESLPEEATEAKSDEYTEEMQARMGTTLTYRHEDGINYNYVLPDLIVGSCLQGPEDVDRLQQAGVTTVFSLQEDCDMEWFGIDIAAIQARCREVGLQHVRFPVRDFDPFDLRLKLPKAVARLAKAHKAGEGAAYIHCTAGLGRAPATALAYMFWMRGWQLPAALEKLKSVRACSPRIEAIRAATADMLTEGKPLDITIGLRRRGTASKVQVAGLDVGWHTLLDLQENPVTHRLEVTRQLLPGSYPFKFILDGTWCANFDYPTYQDGNNVNNIITVLPSNSTEALVTARLLSPTGDLLVDERDKVASLIAELGELPPEPEVKSDEYTEEMQARMGTTLTYRHEDGINYNYVLPDLIVGSCLQGPEDVDRLQQAGVTTVFSLQEDCDMEWFGIDIAAIQTRCREVGLQHVRFPVRDFDPFDLRLKLPKAVARLAKAHNPRHDVIYIHCTAGLGRAPATALAYMFWLRGWQLPAAWEALTSVRACSPRIEAIRAATADLLTDSKALDVTVSMRRRGTASKVQVAGLDVGWHTLLDLQENPVTHRLEVTRQLLPGSYPFKFILDGTWCANHDYPTYKDGDNINNIITVLPYDATDNAVRERLLSQTGDLLPEERLLLSHQLCPWKTHDGRLHFPAPETAEDSSQAAAV